MNQQNSLCALRGGNVAVIGRHRLRAGLVRQHCFIRTLAVVGTDFHPVQPDFRLFAQGTNFGCFFVRPQPRTEKTAAVRPLARQRRKFFFFRQHRISPLVRIGTPRRRQHSRKQHNHPRFPRCAGRLYHTCYRVSYHTGRLHRTCHHFSYRTGRLLCTCYRVSYRTGRPLCTCHRVSYRTGRLLCTCHHFPHLPCAPVLFACKHRQSFQNKLI